MTKSQQLQIRVSARQKAEIQARARMAGEDVSKWVLRQLLPPVYERFQTIARNLAVDSGMRSHAFAEMHDFLKDLSAERLIRAVELPPYQELDEFTANYLAAMIEFCCVLKSISPPAWLSDIEPLDKPWFASALKGLRLYLLTNSPPVFRRRNLFIDSTIGDRV